MEERIADLNDKFEDGMTKVIDNPEQSFQTGKLICKISDELKLEHSMAKGHLLQAIFLMITMQYSNAIQRAHI